MRNHTPFTTILLAGDRAGDPLAQVAPGKRKAMLPLRGQPMIAYVLRTLADARDVGDIIVVANAVADLRDNEALRAVAKDLGLGDRLRFYEGSTGPASSVLKVFNEIGPDAPVLVTTADNPLLTSATVDDFCERTFAAEGIDVTVGLARERDVREVFPDPKRTFLRLKEGGFTGCNLFALMPGAGAKAARAWTEVESRRKKPWQFIAHFGLFTLARALFGRLKLDDAMRAVSRTLDLRAQAIILDDPIAAMDVDRLEHVAIAEAVLAGGIAPAPT